MLLHVFSEEAGEQVVRFYYKGRVMLTARGTAEFIRGTCAAVSFAWAHLPQEEASQARAPVPTRPKERL